MPREPGTCQSLRVEYTPLDPLKPLDADVLAAVVFGADGPRPADPRCLRVDLQPLAGRGLAEIWRGAGRVSLGVTGPIRHGDDGTVLAGRMDLEEEGHGGLAGAAEAAYRELLAFHARSPFRHVWRIWNFVTAINDGDGDDERYKLFCLGRARAFAAAQPTGSDIGYPAATAIGKPRGARTLQVCWIAGREPGATLENPRQVSAYRYPRQYGPAAPSFSRAMLAPGPTLLVSGTASIVGHATAHPGNAVAQLDETLANLMALLARARAAGHADAARLGAKGVLKVYLRAGVDTGTVERRLRERLGTDLRLLILEAEICRSDLLVEIEAVQ
jgi:chorismate lyase/3-hydroxybenzoate synthase